MSLQPAIPRRVALQQSSPPLHQPGVILEEKKQFEKQKSWNGKCASSKLSQLRGSPQEAVTLLEEQLFPNVPKFDESGNPSKEEAQLLQ